MVVATGMALKVDFGHWAAGSGAGAELGHVLEEDVVGPRLHLRPGPPCFWHHFDALQMEIILFVSKAQFAGTISLPPNDFNDQSIFARGRIAAATAL